MKAATVRKTFLDFFASKGHIIVPSAPMVIKNDPTLMFTNAGMNQFKDLFLGNAPIIHPRIADTQKCLRVSGKHNDLEEVGVDTYHHTMFEMLGNWSFGDYFKEDAIAWAWELLTEVYKINPEQLYVTVFEGDPSENLSFDQEAYNQWKKFIPEDRILKGNKKDNFWEMGDTGPCGPCSEIHADIRSEQERSKGDGASLVNMGHPQVIEIWNNVFMEFNRKADGSLEKLPAQHVDTGMGFERLCVVLQEKQSNYDTDVFQPIIRIIEQKSNRSYGSDEKTDIAMRVLADHIRTISFSIADGQLPSNNKAGYVIRRILRRAVRYGYTFLGFDKPFLFELVATLSAEMGPFFPELINQQDLITKVIQEEEQSFLKTLSTGIQRFNNFITNNPQTSIIPGEFAFELFDTFGFPIDLTNLMAREQGLNIDMEAYQVQLDIQKSRSRAASVTQAGDWVQVNEQSDDTRFIGYHTLTADVEIVSYREVNQKGKKQYHLQLDVTPFYAESGGQIGDTGVLKNGDESIHILDTRKEHGLFIHITDVLPNNLHARFEAQVNNLRRASIMNNHTATHLLHAALRTVLGTHVEQKGSLVAPDYLRFDFAHFEKVSDEQIRSIEEMVNEHIRRNSSTEIREISIDDARKAGAMALFGEKYGDVVRMVSIDAPYSIELCGGTHVSATGQLGFFKITSEGAVAAGIRRIEAITGLSAQQAIFDTYQLVQQFKLATASPDPLKKLVSLQEELSEMQRKMESLLKEKENDLFQTLSKAVEEVGQTKAIIQQINLDHPESVKNLTFSLLKEFPDCLIVLGHEAKSKPMLTVAIGNDLLAKGLNAVNIVKELAKEIKGGGGGQPFYATAGGSEKSGLQASLEKARIFTKNIT